MTIFPPKFSLKNQFLLTLLLSFAPKFRRFWFHLLKTFMSLLLPKFPSIKMSDISVKERSPETLGSKTVDCAKAEQISPVVDNPVVRLMELENRVSDLGNSDEILSGSVSGTLDCGEVSVNRMVVTGESVVFGKSGETIGARDSKTLEIGDTGEKVVSSEVMEVDFEENPFEDCGKFGEFEGSVIEDGKVQLGKTLEIDGNPCDDSISPDSLLNDCSIIGGKNLGEKIDDIQAAKTLKETAQMVKAVEEFTQQVAEKVEGVQVGETAEECESKQGGDSANSSVEKTMFRPPRDEGDKEYQTRDDDEKDGIGMDDIIENSVGFGDGLDGNKCQEIVCSTSQEKGCQFDRITSSLSKMFMDKCDCHRCHKQKVLFHRFGGSSGGWMHKPCGCARCFGGEDDSEGEKYRMEMRNPHASFLGHRHQCNGLMRPSYGMHVHSICRRHSRVCNKLFDRRMICDPVYRMHLEQYNQRLGCHCTEGESEWSRVSDPRSNNGGPAYMESEHEWSHRPQSTWSEPEPYPVGAGLANLGNTCFVNSIMQCFTHIVPFVEGLMSLKHDGSSHGNDEFCVLCAVRDQIESSLMSSGKVIYPSKLVDNLNHISLDFRRYQQEDAQELLMCLFDKLDSNWCKYEANSEEPSSSQDSLVKQIFGGRLVSQIRCCKCGHSSDKYDPVIGLSMEIDDVDNVESALKSFTKVENLEGTEKISCDSCKEQVEAEKQLWLDQSPPVAVLHLKRFKSDGICVEKIDRMVMYPLELDLAPFTRGAEDDNDNLKYELFGIVVHVGFSSTSGHYFSYIRSSPDAWYRFDDSKVTKVSEALALDQDAYILYYARKGTPWFSNVLESWKARLEEKKSTSPKSVLDSTEPPSTFSDLGAILRGGLAAGKTYAASDTSTEPSGGLKPDVAESEVGVAAQESTVANVNTVSSSCEPIRDKDLADKVGVDVQVGANNYCVEPLVSSTNTENAGAGNRKDDPSGISTKTCSMLEFGNHPSDPKGDVEINPSTPPRPGSPDIYSNEEPAEVSFQIPLDHLKIQQKALSSKQSVGKAKLELKKKEAFKYVSKAMPSGRRHMFMAALHESQPDTHSSKRRRKQSTLISTHSPRKRVKISPKRVAPVAASV